MGFAVLCLLPLLIPQEPAPGPQPTATTAQQPQPVDDAAALAAAERDAAKGDVATLQRLAIESAPELAARAAFLLARGKDEAHLVACSEVLTKSATGLARQQAMQGLLQNADAKATGTAIVALGDADRAVRTLAVLALGKWRRPAGVEPLLALIDDHRDDEGAAATDVAAALLALHDLGAHDHLLRAATAIDGGKVQGTGEALAYWLQNGSPTLSQDRELPLLLAVLGHRELLVRRFAITRLAQIEQPGAVKALEGRLANEGAELRPLIEVALAQLRRDREPPADEFARLQQNWQAIAKRAATSWQEMPTERRAIVLAIPVVLLLAMCLLVRSHRRKQRAAMAAATVALVQPSQEYLDEQAAYEEELAAAAAAAEDEATAAGEEPPAEDGEWRADDAEAMGELDPGAEQVPVGADDAEWQQDDPQPR